MKRTATIGFTKPLQILNTPQCRLPVRNSRIEIMLLALMIDAESLKSQIPPRPVMRLHWPGQENRALHAQILHPILHNGKLQRDYPRNLNGATERDLAVALRKMQVANAEFGALDVDRQIGLAASAEVLDIAVPAMLGAAGDGSSALLPDLFADLVRGTACVHVLGLGGLGYDPA